MNLLMNMESCRWEEMMFDVPQPPLQYLSYFRWGQDLDPDPFSSFWLAGSGKKIVRTPPSLSTNPHQQNTQKTDLSKV